MIDVFTQPAEAGILLYGGILCGMVYDILRVLRHRFPSRTACHMLDALFVLILLAVLCTCLLLATRGTVRGYLLLFFFGGLALAGYAFAPVFAWKSQKNRK